jgi:hypothetical protein
MVNSIAGLYTKESLANARRQQDAGREHLESQAGKNPERRQAGARTHSDLAALRAVAAK